MRLFWWTVLVMILEDDYFVRCDGYTLAERERIKERGRR